MIGGTPEGNGWLATMKVLSVNVGSVRSIVWQGRTAITAIWKFPVQGRVPLRRVNVAGDDQADRRVHGGPDMAIYAYAREDGEWWEHVLGRPVAHGEFGENLTVRGVAVTNAVIGERWAIGSAVLEVSQPRIPCWKLGARMNDVEFPKRFAEAGRPGAYLRIVQEGDVGAGDDVRIIHRPDHGVTVGDVSHVYLKDRSRVGLLLRAPELAEFWRGWALEAIARK